MTIPMPSLESVTVTVWVKTGSRNEDEKVGGIKPIIELKDKLNLYFWAEDYD